MPYYAVDRLEGTIAVLVADDLSVLDVPRRALPKGLREGSVLQVPTGPDGSPDWSMAVLDEAERQRRVEQVREALDRLRKKDPGGDVRL